MRRSTVKRLVASGSLFLLLCALCSCAGMQIRQVETHYGETQLPRSEVALVGLVMPTDDFASECIRRPPVICRVNSRKYLYGMWAVELLPGRYVIQWEVLPRARGCDVRYFNQDIEVEANGVYTIRCTGDVLDAAGLKSWIEKLPRDYEHTVVAHRSDPVLRNAVDTGNEAIAGVWKEVPGTRPAADAARYTYAFTFGRNAMFILKTVYPDGSASVNDGYYAFDGTSLELNYSNGVTKRIGAVRNGDRLEMAFGETPLVLSPAE